MQQRSEGCIQLQRGCKGYCGRAGAERNAVLAGDPKRIRLLCNTKLITNVPTSSRGSTCRCGLIYKIMDIRDKSEISKYV